MNPTVVGFFTKNAEDGYARQYDIDHGPRLDELIAHYRLREKLAGKRVVDVGGGLGFLGKRLDPSTDYWVIDGAEIRYDQKVSPGTWLRRDLDHDSFGLGFFECERGEVPQFDAGFCLETLEHIGNPHHALVEFKRIVRENGDIWISIPTETVTHNTPYPGLLWPVQNFMQFLGQMALPILDAYIYQPVAQGWPAYTFHCRNAPWHEKRLMFPKQEMKFRDCTALEATNL